MTPKDIRARLMALGEENYRDFQSRLLPTVDKQTILGVRMPALHRLAREMTDEGAFLADLPHRYHEENLLHGLLIARISDFAACLEAIECFLPYIDNWAVCDLPPAKVLASHLEVLREKIAEWLCDEHPFKVRFAIGLLMRFYLREPWMTEALDAVASVQSEEYYVQMMIAWFFAEALVADEGKAMPYFRKGVLDARVRKMAIRKAKESFRVSEACKMALSTEESKNFTEFWKSP